VNYWRAAKYVKISFLIKQCVRQNPIKNGSCGLEAGITVFLIRNLGSEKYMSNTLLHLFVVRFTFTHGQGNLAAFHRNKNGRFS